MIDSEQTTIKKSITLTKNKQDDSGSGSDNEEKKVEEKKVEEKKEEEKKDVSSSGYGQ